MILFPPLHIAENFNIWSNGFIKFDFDLASSRAARREQVERGGEGGEAAKRLGVKKKNVRI